MPLTPSISLNVQGFLNPYLTTNSPNQYAYTLSLVNQQNINNSVVTFPENPNIPGGSYTLLNLAPGMYVSTDGVGIGLTWRIISVVTSPPDPVTGISPNSLIDPNSGESRNDPGVGTIADLIIEDVNNYNQLLSPVNNGSPPDGNFGYVYELNSLGLPILAAVENVPTGQFASEQLARFLANTVSDGPDVKVSQPGNTLQIGEAIYYDSSSNTYNSSNNPTNAKHTIGIVTKIGIPNSDSFSYAPFGTYYDDVSNYFNDANTTTNTFLLSEISGVVAGSILYIDTTGTNQYTTTAPADSAIPIWIYLGLDPVTGKETGILMPFGGAAGGGGGGGGGTADLSNILDADASDNILTKKISLNYSSPTLTITGVGSTFLLQASHPNGSLISNFNFSTSATANAAAATVTMSSKFGSTYKPGLYNTSGSLLGSSTDTTGFQVVLNSNYTMANIPMIIGTVAYWAGSSLVYSQLKFGNTTGTTNSVQALLTPTAANLNTSTGPNQYGAPLTLSITGLSITSGAFGSARDISTTAPLNYSMQVYLEILN